MFPMYMMDPSRMHQQRQRCNVNPRPCFGEPEPQMWRIGGSCGQNPFQRGNPFSGEGSDSFAPVVNLLQNLAGNYATCSREKMNKKEETGMKNEKERKSEAEPQKKTPKDKDARSNGAREDCPFRGLFDLEGVFKNLMTPHDNSHNHKMEKPEKWQQEVDCRGFKSRHIRVKIDARFLLIKANKKEKSEFGVSTASMVKNVPLPKNIDNAKITCKLSPDGVLVIEAPYLDVKKNKVEKHEIFKDILSAFLPGLEETLREHFGNANGESDDTSEQNKTKEEKNVEANEKGHSESDVKSTDDGDAMKTSTFTEQESVPIDEEEDTCKMAYAGKGDNDSRPDEIFPTEKNITVSTDRPIVTLPEDDEQQQDSERNEETDNADSISTSSDDSFVLLSELEKENNGHKDATLDGVAIEVNDRRHDDDDNVDKEEEGNGAEKVDVVEKEKQEAGDEDTAKLVYQDTKTQPKSTETSAVENEKPEETNHHGDRETSSRTRSNGLKKLPGSEDFVYRIEMPSYNPETISVNFDESKGLLVISARAENNGSGKPSSITKKVPIPDLVDANSLHCFFRDGTLTVTAPYRRPVRSIPINL